MQGGVPVGNSIGSFTSYSTLSSVFVEAVRCALEALPGANNTTAGGGIAAPIPQPGATHPSALTPTLDRPGQARPPPPSAAVLQRPPAVPLSSTGPLPSRIAPPLLAVASQSSMYPPYCS